jgi:hypothetical protein
MRELSAYAAPQIEDLGSIADLTRGMGKTRETDDFACTAGVNTFYGSTGQCPPGQS